MSFMGSELYRQLSPAPNPVNTRSSAEEPVSLRTCKRRRAESENSVVAKGLFTPSVTRMAPAPDLKNLGEDSNLDRVVQIHFFGGAVRLPC